MADSATRAEIVDTDRVAVTEWRHIPAPPAHSSFENLKSHIIYVLGVLHAMAWAKNAVRALPEVFSLGTRQLAWLEVTVGARLQQCEPGPLLARFLAAVVPNNVSTVILDTIVAFDILTYVITSVALLKSTCVEWCEVHLWNSSALQTVHLSSLITVLIFHHIHNHHRLHQL